MSMEILLEGRLKKESEWEEFHTFLKQLCEEKQLYMEDHGSSLLIRVCPLGDILCSYAERYLSLAAQTIPAGPGFHAWTCQLFQEIKARYALDGTLHDPTSYDKNHSFEDLKHHHFYPWLRQLVATLQQHAREADGMYVCWTNTDYEPRLKKGCAATPLGYVPLDALSGKDVEEWAESFFVWNEETRTARYYRSCAMALLWQDCYYAYSGMNEQTEKTALAIIDYLEAAYEADTTLPLPLTAYQTLCVAIHREPLIRQGVAMPQEILGYRQNTVGFRFREWSVNADGCAEVSYDRSTDTLCLMAPYHHEGEPWRWLLQAKVYPTGTVLHDSKKIHDTTDALATFTMGNDTCSGTGYMHKQDDHIHLQAVLQHDDTQLYLDGVAKDMETAKLLQQFCEQSSYVGTWEKESLKS